ncbi:reverse transcriptase domain-containing protein [Lactobacillus delbrueckii]|uniref:reverse transcriptase domain-containing protein n=1 Tax=Lactobacillus delbrueckii TaxID=1584 RepID=UPI001780800A|nr:reverse transcriptase domain-containing protein [Lactobacillus delbrueckii]MBD5835958.1 hypothetical protein [Lactobacillus delbrueckii]
MDINEWFEEAAPKSRRRYAHFDLRTNLERAKKYVTNPAKIASHGFYPFIRYDQNFTKFRSSTKEKYGKSREICYSAHIDRCIYQYYSFLLNEKYEEYLTKHEITQVPIAYRSNLGMGNIAAFQKVHQFMLENESCYVMIGDFTDFFGRIDHGYLKKQICRLLQVNRLPADYYAVFKSITQYDTWDLENILRLNGLENTRAGLKQLNLKKRVLTQDQYRKHKENICHHKNSFGIPQGSSISACFSNIYMMEIDEAINSFVAKHKGMYLRYSDDFVIVLPRSSSQRKDLQKLISLFDDYRSKGLLGLQPDKTQVFSFIADKELCNIGADFNPKLSTEHKKINFLGLCFDGFEVRIRSKTISKYYYRMRHKARGIACQYTPKSGFKGVDKLYRMYSERGQYGKGNFLTYVRLVSSAFPKEPIGVDTQNNMVKIRKVLNKNKPT